MIEVEVEVFRRLVLAVNFLRHDDDMDQFGSASSSAVIKTISCDSSGGGGGGRDGHICTAATGRAAAVGLLIHNIFFLLYTLHSCVRSRT